MFNAGKKMGRFEMLQKVGLLTPQYLNTYTVSYAWNQSYFTNEAEFGPELTRKIILQIFSEQKKYKEMTEAERYLELAKFMQEAGWFNEAERELVATMTNHPSAKKIVEERLKNLKEVRANLFVEATEQAASVGQHAVAEDRLSLYDKEEYHNFVSARHRLTANDLKADYEKAKTKIDEAKRLLKALPPLVRSSKAWAKSCDFIVDELNFDTVDPRKESGRLDSFLDFGQQYEMQLKNKKEPTQSIEEILALAISGWLQGNPAPPDTKAALKLVKAREFLLEYLKTDGGLKRSEMLSQFKRDNDLPVDVIARLIRMIPPSHPHDNLSTEVQTLQIQVPDSNGGSYLVQLPPDYHHRRSYPVMMVAHSGREKASETIKRFTEEAAKQGFILVAPLWAGDKLLKSKYSYSDKEHAVVLDTLRDLRRRFQVDSDRVFLFGWEDGANLAYDVGLGNPDLFAGLIPMNGTLQPFARRFYWTNAQYLPLYIIDGERNGNAPKVNRELIKDWRARPVRLHLRGIPRPRLRMVQRRDPENHELGEPQETPHADEGNGPARSRRRSWGGVPLEPRPRQSLLLALDRLPRSTLSERSYDGVGFRPIQAGDLPGEPVAGEQVDQGGREVQNLEPDQPARQRRQAGQPVDHAGDDGLEGSGGHRGERRQGEGTHHRSEPGRDAGGALPHGRSAAAVCGEA